MSAHQSVADTTYYTAPLAPAGGRLVTRPAARRAGGSSVWTWKALPWRSLSDSVHFQAVSRLVDGHAEADGARRAHVGARAAFEMTPRTARSRSRRARARRPTNTR